MQVAKRNRMKHQDPKPGLYWCHYCDRHPVGEGSKCPACKTKHKTRRLKRPAPAIELYENTDG